MSPLIELIHSFGSVCLSFEYIKLFGLEGTSSDNYTVLEHTLCDQELHNCPKKLPRNQNAQSLAQEASCLGYRLS